MSVVKPRNRVLYDQGQVLRAEIRAMMIEHSPVAAPLTAKHIQARLMRTPPPSLRTIQWHVHCIQHTDQVGTQT